MLWGKNTQYNHSLVRHFRCWRKLKYCGRKIKGPLCWKINVLLSSVLVEKNKVHNKQHKQWGNIYHTGLLARPQRMSRPTGPRRGSTCCHINVFKRSPVEKIQEVGMPLVEWVTTPPLDLERVKLQIHSSTYLKDGCTDKTCSSTIIFIEDMARTMTGLRDSAPAPCWTKVAVNFYFCPE